jgi:hypothetical protein
MLPSDLTPFHYIALRSLLHKRLSRWERKTITDELMRECEALGLVECAGEHWKLTPRGLLFASLAA